MRGLRCGCRGLTGDVPLWSSEGWHSKLCHYKGVGGLLGACKLKLICHDLPPSPLFWICSFERTCVELVLDLLQGKELRVGF